MRSRFPTFRWTVGYGDASSELGRMSVHLQTQAAMLAASSNIQTIVILHTECKLVLIKLIYGSVRQLGS